MKKSKAQKALKFDKGKPDLSLIPYEALEELAKVLMYGEKKYGRWNWKKKLNYSRLTSAALRHIHKFNSGIDRDDESGELHLSHAACNLFFLIYFLKNKIKDIDDRISAKTD